MNSTYHHVTSIVIAQPYPTPAGGDALCIRVTESDGNAHDITLFADDASALTVRRVTGDFPWE